MVNCRVFRSVIKGPKKVTRKRVHLAHLGCAKNMVDSEIHLANFHKLGFEPVEEADEADLVIVNTCGFIKDAKEQSIDTIFSMTDMKRPKVLVTGCLFQRYGDLNQQIPEVDGWLSSNTMEEAAGLAARLGFDIPQSTYFATDYTRVALESSPFAYLRIAEGCNKNCAFCSIPGFKGRMNSFDSQSLVQEAQELEKRGVVEVNIVCQDTANYGADLFGPAKGGRYLKELLQALLRETAIPRFRLLYLYPLWLDADFYEFMASEPRIANYIDMPLQHASKAVLQSMKRPGSGEQYLEELGRIRRIFGGQVALRTTFIVGFPGETKEQFEQLRQFVRDADFDWIGAFTYSHEEGTKAGRMKNDVHWKTREKRKDILMRDWQETKEKRKSLSGEVREVMLEELSGDWWIARSQYEAPEVDGVIHVQDPQGYPGKLTTVRMTNELDVDWEAALLEKQEYV